MMDILLFQPEEDAFGIKLTAVDEILNMASLRKIPHAPIFMAGLFNLRGKLLPVVDLILKIGLKRQEPPLAIIKDEPLLSSYPRDTRLLVTQIGEQPIAVIIESIKQILTIDCQTSKKQHHPDTHSFLGDMIMQEDGTTIQLIDLDRILSPEEIHMLDTI